MLMDDAATGAASDAAHREPVDADVGVAAERSVGGWRRGEAPVVAAITGGGVVGAVARYQAGLWWPTAAGQFPWTTLVINAVGCGLIGVLLVLLTDVFPGRGLARPLLGTGVLGGFTTFSTYAVDSQRLMATGHAGLALGNLAGTVATAMLAVTAATWLTRRAVAASRGPAVARPTAAR